MQTRTDNQEVLRLGQDRTLAEERFKGVLAWLMARRRKQADWLARTNIACGMSRKPPWTRRPVVIHRPLSQKATKATKAATIMASETQLGQLN
jgi:hypothetical protein